MVNSSTQEPMDKRTHLAVPGGEWETLWDKSVSHTKSIPERILYFICRWIWHLACLIIFRPQLRGGEHMPKKGSLLLLSNHVAMLDPALVTYRFPRSDVHYMAASTLFRVPLLGPLIRKLGAFPKAKFVKDRGAMKDMLKVYEKGGVVAMWPEGHRTWDGRTEPVLPGIGRLLKRKAYRIQICRNLTGHLNQPRWATYPRWVPVLLEYDAPIVVDQDLTVEEINDLITDLIRVDPTQIEVPAGSWGFKMAHGLESYLWACPHCLAEEGLKLDPSDGNAIECSECSARWQVDVACDLVPESGPAMPIRIFEASDHIKASISEEALIRGQDSAGRDIILTCDGITLTQRNKETGEDSVLATGRALLVRGGLVVQDAAGETLWEADLDELLAVSVDLGVKIFVRTRTYGLLALRVPGQSHIKWTFMINKQLNHKS